MTKDFNLNNQEVLELVNGIKVIAGELLEKPQVAISHQ